MTIKTYYVSKSGNEYLTTNFKVKEFQCKDKSDKILIDSDLVFLLQKIRDYFKKPVIITSAYRTPTYNTKIGSSNTSFHVKGMAVDIQITGVNPVIVAMYAETLNLGGIGLYSYVTNGFVHVDTRPTKYRWLQLTKTSGYEGISKILPTIKQGVSNNINVVKLLQRQLELSQSGTFGDLTTKAVKDYQNKNGLSVDGIVGKNTWTRLFS